MAEVWQKCSKRILSKFQKMTTDHGKKACRDNDTPNAPDCNTDENCSGNSWDNSAEASAMGALPIRLRKAAPQSVLERSDEGRRDSGGDVESQAIAVAETQPLVQRRPTREVISPPRSRGSSSTSVVSSGARRRRRRGGSGEDCDNGAGKKYDLRRRKRSLTALLLHRGVGGSGSTACAARGTTALTILSAAALCGWVYSAMLVVSNAPSPEGYSFTEGRDYTYTDAETGFIAAAPLPNIRRVKTRDGGTAGDVRGEGTAGGALAHHRPRHPYPPNVVFYSTPNMESFDVPLWKVVKRSEEASNAPPGSVIDPMLRVELGEEPPSEQQPRQPYVQGDCVPMKEWQVQSSPNCNTVHELDMEAAGKDVNAQTKVRTGGGVEDYHPTVSDSNGDRYSLVEDNVFHLARGWFRDVWRVDMTGMGGTRIGNTVQKESIVLKTLR